MTAMTVPASGAYKKYLLSVLMVILAFNFVDRMALGLLLQDIKIELDLSDTQLGFLSGIAFAFFYAIMGLPIARWADRGNRVTIIALTTALWSAAVALCGVAASFVQLLLIRIGVAVGEAGCIPPAHSLIADYFSRAERPRAVARYMLGAPLSLLLGLFLAGWINEFYGWRATFMLLGLPGLVLAPMAWLTLREPRRVRACDAHAPTPSAQLSFQAVCVTLWHNRTFRHLLLCWSLASFFSNGITLWKPAFFIRSYGMETGEVGTWFAVLYGIGGILGTYWGGELATRRAAHDERLQLRAMALAYCVFGSTSFGIYIVSDRYVAFALMGLAAVGGNIVIAPLFATIQTLVPERMRALSIALVYLFSNFIGMGLGPLAAGALSDAFRPWAAEESLRYALLALCPGYFLCGWLLWRGSATVALDVEAVRVADRQDAVEAQRNPRNDSSNFGEMSPSPAEPMPSK